MPAAIEQIEWLKIHGFNLESDDKTRNNVGAIFKVVDQVVAMNCQTGIAVVELGTIEVNTLAAFYAEQKHSIRKTVNIWVDCEPEFNQSGGLKVFSFSVLKSSKATTDEKLISRSTLAQGDRGRSSATCWTSRLNLTQTGTRKTEMWYFRYSATFCQNGLFTVPFVPLKPFTRKLKWL